jgi:hypothetical protein
MKSESLQYYIHDESQALRFELAGSLSGAGAQSVYQAWRTALSIVGARPVIVDITFLDAADERGRSVLLTWYRSGARIVAGSPESRELAQDILGEPIPALPAKSGWFRRWTAALFKRSAVVDPNPEPAERTIALPAAKL